MKRPHISALSANLLIHTRLFLILTLRDMKRHTKSIPSSLHGGTRRVKNWDGVKDSCKALPKALIGWLIKMAYAMVVIVLKNNCKTSLFNK